MQVEIEIVLDDGSLAKGFTKATKQAKKSGKKAGTQFFSSFSRRLLTLGATLGAALISKKTIDAAIHQEEAINKLNSALVNAGQFSNQASQELQNYASQLQRITIHGDEAILGQMGFAMAMGASVDQSKEVVRVATEMSAALGMDLNSAVRNTAKTVGCYGGELSEVIPVLKYLTVEQLRAGDGIDLLAKKFKGFAERESNTFRGAMTQMQNSFGDLLERIGERAIKSPAIIGLMKGLKGAIEKVSDKIKDLGKNNTIIKDLIVGILDFGISISHLITPLTFVANYFKLVFVNLKLVLQGFVTVWATAIGWMAELAMKLPFVGKDNEILQGLVNFKDSSQDVFGDMTTEWGEAWDNLKNTSSDFEVSFRDIVQGIKNSVLSQTEAIVEGGNKSADAQKKLAETLKRQNDHINKSINATLVRGVTMGIQTVVKSLAFGEDGFKAFGKAILGMVGELATNLGMFFIAEGIAQTALASNPFTAGGAMVAAGAALVALGTLLSGLGGESSAGGGVAAPLPTDPTSIASAATNELTDEIEEEERKDPDQRVSLVVNGDIFDHDETSSRLLDMLNENFQNKGSRIIEGIA